LTGGLGEKCRKITRPFAYRTMVVEVEVGGQTGLQLTHRVILVEIDVVVFDAAPQAFAEDVVEDAAAAIHADLNVGREQAGGKGLDISNQFIDFTRFSVFLQECLVRSVSIFNKFIV